MIKEHVVQELREMFLDGATPSRLMMQIQTHHPEEERLYFLIMDYFQEAFKLPLVRVSSNNDFSTPSGEHFHFNRDLVHEIVCQLERWKDDDADGSWLDDVNDRARTTLREHQERLKTAHFEELERIWDQLTDDERGFIIRRIAHKDYLWDKVNTLSRLVERLQQKIVQLESLVEIKSN